MLRIRIWLVAHMLHVYCFELIAYEPDVPFAWRIPKDFTRTCISFLLKVFQETTKFWLYVKTNDNTSGQKPPYTKFRQVTTTRAAKLG